MNEARDIRRLGSVSGAARRLDGEAAETRRVSDQEEPAALPDLLDAGPSGPRAVASRLPAASASSGALRATTIAGARAFASSLDSMRGFSDPDAATAEFIKVESQGLAGGQRFEGLLNRARSVLRQAVFAQQQQLMAQANSASARAAELSRRAAADPRSVSARELLSALGDARDARERASSFSSTMDAVVAFGRSAEATHGVAERNAVGQKAVMRALAALTDGTRQDRELRDEAVLVAERSRQLVAELIMEAVDRSSEGARATRRPVRS